MPSLAAVEAFPAGLRSVWDSKCCQPFHTLQHALRLALTLALPNFDKLFKVVFDTCEIAPAVCAVLLQDGHPVTFFSKPLNGPEAKYFASDIETLAMSDALRKWRCYLEGQRFVVETDHQPNTYLHTSTNPHTLRRRARRLLETGAHDFEHHYTNLVHRMWLIPCLGRFSIFVLPL